MNTTDHLCTHNNLIASRQATDVKLFFSILTDSYDRLTKGVLELISNMDAYTPQQILEECNKLREKRNKLVNMDQQLIDIMDLAGNEIAQSPMVNEYQIVFSRANMACNNLYQKLLLLKEIMGGQTWSELS
jgi:predicted nucleic acid-binding protein